MFTPFDFLDLGSPYSVGMTLLRLARAGTLRHLGRGLYDVPRTHSLLGELLPTAEAIAKALARKDGATIQPAEAMAANLLRLSEQVTARRGILPVIVEKDFPVQGVRGHPAVFGGCGFVGVPELPWFHRGGPG